MKKYLWLIPIAFCVALDQITKFFVVKSMENYESITVINGVLNFTRTPNDGAAMGILDGHRWVFMTVSTVMIVGLLVFMFTQYKKYYSPFLYASFSMVVGGGIGNMIDRTFFVEVVDFIDVRFLPFWKWVFNVADIFICVGCVMAAAYFIYLDIKEMREKKAGDHSSTN